MNPTLILADEPTGNLDKKTGIKVRELLLELCREFKATMLLVTHDQDLASCFNPEAVHGRRSHYRATTMTIKYLFIITMALLSAARLYAQTPLTITAIEVQGNARVEAEAIVAALQSQRGQPLDQATVQRDFAHVFMSWVTSPTLKFCEKTTTQASPSSCG